MDKADMDKSDNVLDIEAMSIVELGNLLYEEILKSENVKNNISILQQERNRKINLAQKSKRNIEED